MKKILKNPILTFILGAIMFSGITGVLAYKLAANQVGFTPSDTTWQVSDVDNALDSLFDMATYGDASASDIKSGKTALVNGTQVTGNLTVPNYTTLANTENVSAGSSSTARTGYYYLNNYKVTCGTTTCPSYTSLSGTQNVSAGSSSTLLNGYYNLSNYRVSCGTNSCPSSDGKGVYWNYGTISPSSTGSTYISVGFNPSKIYMMNVPGSAGFFYDSSYDSSKVYYRDGSNYATKSYPFTSCNRVSICEVGSSTKVYLTGGNRYFWIAIK